MASRKTHLYTRTQFIEDIQLAIGAEIDGVAGIETLYKTLTISEVLNRKHPAVYYIQRRLLALGSTEVGRVDGIADHKFTSAVMHFQADKGCDIDGELTARSMTWKKLLGMK